jgi:lambda family phage portal protein
VANSTIRENERWDARVGRWVSTAPAPAPAPEPKPVVVTRTVVVDRGRAVRMYANARNSRTNTGFGSSGNSSADAELYSSLTSLRARSRQMVRDNPYAKRVKTLVVNNIIGAGVGMQAQVMTTRDSLATSVNDRIEEEFCDWCEPDSCHTGGALHFHDLERLAAGEVFEAGEVFVRKHYRKFGRSRIPLSLEVVEAERLAHEYLAPIGSVAPGHEVRMGVELDEFGRAVAYFFRKRHPGDIRLDSGSTDLYERVLAEDVYHLRLITRWPQTRGEPWMHTVLVKLDNINEYSDSELKAARASSYVFGTIETKHPEAAVATTTELDSAGKQMMAIEPLTVQELEPGEELKFHNPTRPNVALEPFIRYMLREVAVGTGPTYADVSGDYSQSNYSSSRLALLSERDQWRVLQQWWIRNFRLPLHRDWLKLAVLQRAADGEPVVPLAQYAMNPRKYEAVRFKPRGWSWVDPTKEVAAYKEAIKGGLTTLTDVIAQTAGGQDIEDWVRTRERELELLAKAEIAVDTTVGAAAAAPPPPPPPADPPDEDDEDDEDTTTTRPERVVSFRR